MKLAILRSAAGAGLLLLTTLNGAAMTLGAPQGGALIGRPLDWSMPVRLDPGEDSSALCAEVDVSYADTRLDPAKVTLRTTAGPEKGQVLLRVTSLVTVDEPVVTIVLRVGCTVKNIRRYVLLADLPVDVDGRPVQISPPLMANAPLKRSRQTNAGSAREGGESFTSSQADAARPGAALRQTRPRARTALAGRPDSANATVGKSRSPAGGLSQSLRLGESGGTSTGRPRLQLDSADLLAGSIPSLKSATQLQGAPLENEPRRAEFAVLWRALNLRTEEISRDMQRLDALQSETRSLREDTTNAQTELGAVRQQLKKAENERYNNALVYALIALLLAAIAGAFYTRYHFGSGRAGRVWWDKREPERAEAELRTNNFSVDSGRDDWRAQSRPVPIAATPERNVYQRSAPSSVNKLAESGFLPSTLHANPRGVNVHELFDVAQQADFFVSLGQHDHAIEVLLNHIRESVQTSPLAYLDLFRLYHDMGYRDDYDELRTEFNRIFNADLPQFAAFKERGEGLEAYEDAMERIQSLWNTPGVLDAIEESIFRKPDSSAEAFGLEAYRELLLLYAVANELFDPDGLASRESALDMIGNTSRPTSPPQLSPSVSVRVPDVFLPTSPQPLAAVSLPRGGGNYVPLRVSSPASARSNHGVGLDIDLSNPLLGHNSSSRNDTVFVPRTASGADSNAGSGWLEFDLGELEDDSHPEEDRSKLPKA